ncbi:hypothetical protein ACFE04_008432 [Oxalis oulophora]
MSKPRSKTRKAGGVQVNGVQAVGVQAGCVQVGCVKDGGAQAGGVQVGDVQAGGAHAGGAGIGDLQQMYWGLDSEGVLCGVQAADGSVVIFDNLDIIKGSCAKSFAPFPNASNFVSNLCKSAAENFEEQSQLCEAQSQSQPCEAQLCSMAQSRNNETFGHVLISNKNFIKAK